VSSESSRLHWVKLSQMRQLWCTLRDLSDNPDDLSSDDFKLWDAICRHSDIQALLDTGLNRKDTK